MIVLQGEVIPRVNNDFTSTRDGEMSQETPITPPAIGLKIRGGVQSHDDQDRYLFLRFIV